MAGEASVSLGSNPLLSCSTWSPQKGMHNSEIQPQFSRTSHAFPLKPCGTSRIPPGRPPFDKASPSMSWTTPSNRGKTSPTSRRKTSCQQVEDQVICTVASCSRVTDTGSTERPVRGGLSAELLRHRMVRDQTDPDRY